MGPVGAAPPCEGRGGDKTPPPCSRDAARATRQHADIARSEVPGQGAITRSASPVRTAPLAARSAANSAVVARHDCDRKYVSLHDSHRDCLARCLARRIDERASLPPASRVAGAPAPAPGGRRLECWSALARRGASGLRRPARVHARAAVAPCHDARADRAAPESCVWCT